jgi:hypothetical protein
MPVNFDDTQLPPTTIEQIYKSLLVELNVKEELPENNPVSIPYLGDNQQRILLIVNDSNSKFMSDSDYKFLTGILTACKLSVEDVALVNLHTLVNKNYSQLLNSLKPKVAILFGTLPAEIELPVNFPQFQIQAFQKVSFLSTPDLGTIESDKLIKSKLWLCLKQIFTL